MNLNIPSSVYIHLPFCNHICSYCDFCKVYYNSELVDKYLDSLEIEIINRYHQEEVKTLYLGGGTPSSLSLKQLKRLFSIIKRFNLSSDLEFTFEANIDSLDKEKALFLYQNKVNRLSLGIQTFDKDNLKLLQRKHTKEEVFNKIKLYKEIGFTNISIDLIYGIDYNLDKVEEDINNFLLLDIPHISCYSLILEDHTILKIEGFKEISSDIDYQMYLLINKKLTDNNYFQYEISNYAKENYVSKHNLNYWHNGDYYGFGLSAVSYLNHQRITNTKNLSKYLQHEDILIIQDESIQEQIENEIFLNLRTIKGLDLELFYQKYHYRFRDLFDITELLNEKMIIIKNNYLHINKKYLYVMDEIIIKILEGVKNDY